MNETSDDQKPTPPSFEAVVAGLCFSLMLVTVMLQGEGDMPRVVTEDASVGYFAQYISTLLFTLLVVFFVNAFRDNPINRWRIAVATQGLVIMGNLGLILISGVRDVLAPHDYGGFVADATFGGILLLPICWWASARYQRKQKEAAALIEGELP